MTPGNHLSNGRTPESAMSTLDHLACLEFRQQDVSTVGAEPFGQFVVHVTNQVVASIVDLAERSFHIPALLGSYGGLGHLALNLVGTSAQAMKPARVFHAPFSDKT